MSASIRKLVLVVARHYALLGRQEVRFRSPERCKQGEGETAVSQETNGNGCEGLTGCAGQCRPRGPAAAGR